MEFRGRGLLLDIEGTTSSVSFVYDVMFPYARKRTPEYLAGAWDAPATRKACDLLATDAGYVSFEDWKGRNPGVDPQKLVVDEVNRLMDGDVKSTGLKELQGLVWEAGFQSGELTAHVYDDVPPALKAWNDAHFAVWIYSSGSIAAQKLFFGHSIAGDLLPYFRGHYDTTTGPKKSAYSYAKILLPFPFPKSDVLFLSDVVAELDAARDAGLQTALVVRPGNAPAPEGHDHPVIQSFSELDLIHID